MIPGAPSSSDLEVERLVDSNLVDNPGWFEGRLYRGGGWIVVDIHQV